MFQTRLCSIQSCIQASAAARPVILGPEETDTVEKLTIMTFVNEMMQFLLKDSTYPSQPGSFCVRKSLCRCQSQRGVKMLTGDWQVLAC